MKIDRKTKRQITELIIIFGIVLWCVFNYTLFFDLIKFIIKLIMPLIAGVIIAFIINVPMNMIENKWFNVKERKHKKLIRLLSLAISILLIVGIVVLIFFLVIPEFIDALNSLLKNMPNNVNIINDLKERLIDIYPSLKDYIKSVDANVLMENTIGSAGNVISIVITFLSNMISKLITMFIGFIISIYVLADKENLIYEAKKILDAFFNENVVKEIKKVVKLANITFTNFLTGQCLDACLTGFEFFIILSIMRVPYALILGVLFAITALIPYIGGFITLVIGSALVLAVNPVNTLWFILAFFLVQQFDDNFTYPKIVGKKVGLPPLFALIAVVLGGSIFGFIGMIISIPLASILYSVFKDVVNQKIEIKRQK